jgi:hypothetical protein
MPGLERLNRWDIRARKHKTDKSMSSIYIAGKLTTAPVTVICDKGASLLDDL